MRPGFIGSFRTSSRPSPPPGTLPPPGTPEFWFDGFDIDGSQNSSLGIGVGVGSWLNKGVNATTAVLQATPSKKPTYYVDGAFQGLSFDNALFQHIRALCVPHYPSIVGPNRSSWFLSVIARNIPGSSHTAVSSEVQNAYSSAVSFPSAWSGYGGNPPDLGVLTTTNTTVNVASFWANGNLSQFHVDSVAPTIRDAGWLPWEGPLIGDFSQGTDSGFGWSGEIYQVLVYYGLLSTSPSNIVPTHADILTWANTVYGGTAPYTP